MRMRIRIQLITLMRIRMRIRIFIWCGLLFDADADPGYQNDAYPDPQHWKDVRKNPGERPCRVHSLVLCFYLYLSVCLFVATVDDWQNYRPLNVSPSTGPKHGSKHKSYLGISWVWSNEDGMCCGSVTFWFGSGYADPCFWTMDPDLAIFVLDLQDANKKLFFSKFFCFLLS